MNKRWMIVISVISSVLLVAALASAKVLDPKISDKPVGKVGGVFKYGSIGTGPKTFNPIIANESSSNEILDLVFRGLTTVNGDTAEIEPDLATYWEFNEDGTEWTFYLRRGVTWHDGVELTADDVVFTYDVIFDDSIPTSARDVLTIDGQYPKVEKIDKYTVKFILPKPFAPLLVQLGQEIIPKHKLYDAWKEGKFNETWGIDTDPKEIVGNGPFKLAEYKHGQYTVLTRNPNYYEQDSEGTTLPYLQRFIFVYVPDTETLSLKFQAGEVDYYGIRGSEIDLYRENQEKWKIKIIDGGPAFSSNFFVLNQKIGAVPEPKINWFRDKRFRQALSYALDRQAIIDQIFAGNAQPMWGPVYIPVKKWYNPNIRTYPYNLDKAMALLEEAGFTKGEDGVLRDKDGNKVEFSLFTNSSSNDRVAMCNLAKEDWAKLGIKVNFQPLEFNLLVEKLLSGENWEAILIGLYGAPIEPNGSRNTWTSSGTLHMWWPKMETPDTDWQKRIDEIFDQGAVTLDQQKRKALYDEWQMIASEEVPLIYTVSPLTFYGYRSYVQNVNPKLGDEFNDVTNWWIKK